MVALAVAVGKADARDVFQHVFHGLDALVLDHALRHDVDCLRNIAKGRIDFQCATAVTGLVALLLVSAGNGSGGQGEGVLGFSMNSRDHQKAQHG
ncbi:hypothetical protein D3C81_1301440 [compost metagenome]